MAVRPYRQREPGHSRGANPDCRRPLHPAHRCRPIPARLRGRRRLLLPAPRRRQPIPVRRRPPRRRLHPRRQTRPLCPANRRSRRWPRPRPGPGPGLGTMASPRPASRLVRRLLPARLLAQLDDRSRHPPRRRASRSGRRISRPLLPPRPPGRRHHHRGLRPWRGRRLRLRRVLRRRHRHGWLRPWRSLGPRRRQWRDPRRRRRSPGRRHLRRPGWPSRHRRRRARQHLRQHLRRVPRLRRRRQRSARRTSPDARQGLGRSVVFREGGLSRAKAAPKGPYFLASGRNRAIHRAISHGSMAHKAVRWQPGRQRSVLLTRFRRNQPEN